MSRGRTYYGVSDFKTINKELGIKNFAPAKNKDKKYDEGKRKSQRAKFCRCSKCKGMMTYVPNTNTLVCDNVVTKKKIKVLQDGSKKEFEVQERCGAVNVVGEQYQDYLKYLFDGVPADIAVTENKEEK